MTTTDERAAQRAQVALALIGAAALIVTAVQTSISSNALDETRNALQISRQQKDADQFASAMTGIGATNDQNERYAAIQVLGAMMEDADTAREYQPAIIRQLSVYVLWHQPTDHVLPSYKVKPKPDVQAALNVLLHRNPNIDREASVDLRRAYLVGANLRGAVFDNSDLSSADLRCADLTGANFSDAAVRGLKLKENRGLDAKDRERLAVKGAEVDSTFSCPGEPES